MEVVKKNISELNVADYNPRVPFEKGSKEYESLKKSITEFGYVNPIVFNERTGTVVGGHQRLMVLADLGYTEVDVALVNLDETEEKALNVALNKVSGKWEYGELATLLEELRNTKYAEFTGFTSAEISGLLDDVAVELQAVEDEEEEDAYGEEAEDVPVRIGSYKFTLTHDEWEELSAKIRLDVGFSKSAVIAELERRVFESAV